MSVLQQVTRDQSPVTLPDAIDPGVTVCSTTGEVWAWVRLLGRSTDDVPTRNLYAMTDRDASALAALILIYLVWDGAAESVYSLATAQASDRATRDDLVALSSSLLFAWSVAGFLVPGLVTLLSALYGTQVFIHVAVAIALAYALFVVWRVASARAAPATASFAPMAAQAPPPVDLAFAADEAPRRGEP